MGLPSHASITERLTELLHTDTPAAARERESLRELCAGIGHQYVQPGYYGSFKPPRMCAVCLATEG